MARADQSLFEQHEARGARATSRRPRRSAPTLGVTLAASGAASEPGMSLKRQRGRPPWSLCRRPWSLMYFTANGRALPCCIAPFSAARLRELHARRRDADRRLREIWNGARLHAISARLAPVRPPPGALPELRAALEPLSDGGGARHGGPGRIVCIPTLNEAGYDRPVVGRDPAGLRRTTSSWRTAARRTGRRRPPRPPAPESIDGGPGLWPGLRDRRGGRRCLEPTSSSSWTATARTTRRPASPASPAPVLAGTHDFVLGVARPAARASRARCSGIRSPPGGSPGSAMGRSTVSRYTRHVRLPRHRPRRRCSRLGMREMTYGWNIEMQMQAARAGLRILEVPLPYRRRAGGASKVAGSFRGTLRAGAGSSRPCSASRPSPPPD